MSRSSDSDSDRSGKYRKKHYRRSRSNSSDSSDSSSCKKKSSVISSKYSKGNRRYKSRSRSRDNSRTSSYRSSPGRDRDKRKYKSRKSASPIHSPIRLKKKQRSVSREKSTSRSSTQSCLKNASDKSFNILAKDEFSIEPRIKQSTLDEINTDSFTQKQFISSSSLQLKDKKVNRNIVIDITADTIQIPPAPNILIESKSIFHISITSDLETRSDKWVKKLYNLRQKALADVVSN